MQDIDMFWDFISLRPETTHQVSFLFSDRGIPDGYRHMNGYGSHTFKMVGKDGQLVYCKFHYKVCIVTCTYNVHVSVRCKNLMLHGTSALYCNIAINSYMYLRDLVS